MIACPGDCDHDDTVYISELLLGVNIALGLQPVSRCPSSDIDASGHVTINELVAVVNAVLHGCFATPSPSATPTVTPTPRPNRVPLLGTLSPYRAYPGEEIRFVVPASDPDGDSLQIWSDDLPEGATLDGATGEFHWLPTDDQIGLFSVLVTVADGGSPPLEASDFLFLAVHPLDGCVTPECDPAAGCSTMLPDVAVHCCVDDPLPRVFDPAADCPGTATLFLGRNGLGFGRLQNCDEFRVRNFAQSSAVVVFNLGARCLNTSAPILVHSTMRSTTRFVFEDEQTLDFTARDDGFAEYKYLQIPVQASGPFNDMQGQEANLAVTVVDADGVSAREEVRLRLTFTPIPDLPEAVSPQARCPMHPAACQSSGRATLVIERNLANPQDASLTWKWLDGVVAERANFGDPLGPTSYAFCLYDDGDLAGTYEIPRAFECSDQDCWRAVRQNRYEFDDGSASVTLRAGSPGAQIVVQLQGTNSLSTAKQLPLHQLRNVTTQLITGEVPQPRCWQSVFFPPATANTTTRFDDKL